MITSINYDLRKPGHNYIRLYEAIKGLGSWWHHLGATWLVNTDLDAAEISKRLTPLIDANDSMLVIGVTSDRSGWLPKEAWNWINKHLENKT
jgi:hypothetical protein